MSIEEALAATLLPMLRETVRAELRAALAEIKPQAPGEYLSATEAARIADVHPETVRQWVREGRLPRHQAGSALRIRRSDLESFLEAGSAKPTGETIEARAAAILNRKRGG